MWIPNSSGLRIHRKGLSAALGSEKDAETKEVIKWVLNMNAKCTGPSCMQTITRRVCADLRAGAALVKADPEYFFALAIMTEAVTTTR